VRRCARARRLLRPSQRGGRPTADLLDRALLDRLRPVGAVALLEVLLVVLLRRPVDLGRLELGRDLGAANLLLQLREHVGGDPRLLGGVGVDAVAVLRPAVVPHLVDEEHRAAEPAHEHGAELLVAHLRRVEEHLHGLGVAGLGAAHLLV
jgi:hypothetical protein